MKIDIMYGAAIIKPTGSYVYVQDKMTIKDWVGYCWYQAQIPLLWGLAIFFFQLPLLLLVT